MDIQIDLNWLKTHFLLFLDFDQVILGYHYTSSGIIYGPIDELVLGITYLCQKYQGIVISLTAGKLQSKAAIQKYYDRHSPMWDLAEKVYDHIPRSPNLNRGQCIEKYLEKHFGMEYLISSRDRIWILDDSLSEYTSTFTHKRLISKRDRLSHLDLAFMEYILSNRNPVFHPFANMSDPRYMPETE